MTVKHWRSQIEEFLEREKGTNTVDVEKAKAARIEAVGVVLLDRVKKDWKKT